MWIKTRPASASVSLEARTPTQDQPIPTREGISFELLPDEGRDHLDLDTGEVFQDHDYARVHKKEKKLIGATMTVGVALDDSHYRYNFMRYQSEMKGDDYFHPAAIHFQVFIAPAAFRELADNIKSGVLPNAITVQLPDEPLFTSSAVPKKKKVMEYGWEPDGSGMIWHNQEKEDQAIPMEGVRFDYAIAKARYDEKQMDRLLPIQPHGPADRLSEQLAPIEALLSDMAKHLRWTTRGVVALGIIIAILFATQRMPF